MQMILMGTGTSHGVPVIACNCEVCRSADAHDKRMRSSAYVTQEEADGSTTAIIIDTGPELRMQCLRYGVMKVDAVLLTHSHADHLDGLDDVRVFSHTLSQGAVSKLGLETPGPGLAVYSNATSLIDVRNRFDYIFKTTQLGGGKPKLRLVDCACYTAENPIQVHSIRVIPIPMMHGSVSTTGYLLSITAGGTVHSIAYLTDLNYITDDAIRIITDNCGILDHLVIDGLREKHHSTHFTFAEAAECATRLPAAHTWLTHICHSSSHQQIEAWCDAHNSIKGRTLHPAYDGLCLQTT